MRRRHRKSRRQEPAKQEKGLKWTVTLVGVCATFAAWGYSINSPLWASILYFVSVLFAIAAVWELFPFRANVKTIIAALLVLAFIIVDAAWIRYATRPSFVFLIPGVWLNGDTWDFIVNHRGREPLYNVEIVLVDEDRAASLRAQGAITPADVATEQTVVRFPEIHPKGGGSTFAKQILWKPFSPQHAHFSIVVSSRASKMVEDLRIERFGDTWLYRMTVKDGLTGSVLDRATKVFSRVHAVLTASRLVPEGHVLVPLNPSGQRANGVSVCCNRCKGEKGTSDFWA